MDPEQTRGHAGRHDEVVTYLDEGLAGVPGAVDGGIAADTVVSIMDRVSTAVADLADVHVVVAGILREIADDSQRTDEAAAAEFTVLIDALGDE